MLVRVELLADRVEALEAVLGKSLNENLLGHLEAVVEVNEVGVALLVVGRDLVGRDSREGTVEVVDAVDEILGELLDGKVARALDVALGAVLQVAEVGDGSEALVLLGKRLVSFRAQELQCIIDRLPSTRGPRCPWPRDPS